MLQSPLRIGAVPDVMFQRSAGTSIVACGSPGNQLFRVTLERPDGGKYVLEVDPKIGYRYRSYKSYRPDGKLGFLAELDDYRLVDGLYFPFRYETTHYGSSGTIVRHEKIRVQEAHFNQKLPPDALLMTLAPGTTFSAAARNGPVPSQIKEVQVLGISELKALYGAPAASQPEQVPVPGK